MSIKGPGTTTKHSLGPPRIFVEVIREVEGNEGILRTRKEIGLEQFHQARISLADRLIEECLAEMSIYDRR